jgi:predicted Ser/Thr protein kinase
MDLPKLKKYVSFFLKKYKPSKQEPVDEPLFDKMEHIIHSMIKEVSMEDPNYWTPSGIRIESKDYYNCEKQLTMTKIGKGAFGTVYKVPVKPCMKNIPSGVKVVAVKMEKIDYSKFYKPHKLKTIVDITKKAHEIGIGPALYDVFILKGPNFFSLVKVYEHIEGREWGNFKSTKEMTNAVAQLKQHIHTMNKAGIIHHDLHEGNVMISNDKIYIVDFDRANFYETEEEENIYRFEQNEYDDFSQEQIRLKTIYVFNMLVNKKIIKTGTRTTRKNR